MNAPVVELNAVSQRFGSLLALDNVSLQLAGGEVVGLLGHNGAGKTTAIKLLLGLNVPSSGSVSVFGRHPDHYEVRRQLGYLPENVSFYPQMTGIEVLRFCARLKQANLQQVDELLSCVGLQDAAQRRVKTYSKGMRQRLGLAQALLGAPKLLLLDEPTVGLDPSATRDFYQLVEELRAQGSSIVLCSHVLADVERHIDRAVILGHGRLLASGSLTELRDQAQLPLIIRARGQFAAHWQEPSQQLGQGRRINGHHYELRTSAGQKMTALRQLLADPAVEDLEVEPASLDALYAHFMLNESGIPGQISS